MLVYVARVLQLWPCARQLSYKDPYVILTFVGKKNGLGSAHAQCCTSFFTLRNLDCASLCLADLHGVAWMESKVALSVLKIAICLIFSLSSK